MVRYKIIFLMTIPFAIVMSPVWHPIYVSIVSSHGLPNIRGYPFNLFLGLITRKSTMYSQESIEMIISSKVPSIFTTDLLANSNIMEVNFNVVIPRIPQVYKVKMFITDPKYTKVFGKLSPPI